MFTEYSVCTVRILSRESYVFGVVVVVVGMGNCNCS